MINYKHKIKTSVFKNKESIVKLHDFHKKLTWKCQCQECKAKFYQPSDET